MREECLRNTKPLFQYLSNFTWIAINKITFWTRKLSNHCFGKEIQYNKLEHRNLMLFANRYWTPDIIKFENLFQSVWMYYQWDKLSLCHNFSQDLCTVWTRFEFISKKISRWQVGVTVFLNDFITLGSFARSGSTCCNVNTSRCLDVT